MTTVMIIVILGAVAVLCHKTEKVIEAHLQGQEDWDYYNDVNF